MSNAIASLAKAWPGKTVTIVQAGVGKQVIDRFINMAYAMLVGIGLVDLLLVPLVILFALQLAVIGAFVALAATGHATIITGVAVSLQATLLPVTVISAGIWIAYSVGGGLYGMALVAVAMLSVVMLSMVSIVVAVNSYLRRQAVDR